MFQLRLNMVRQLLADPVCQHLSQFYSPLIEGIDVPDRSLDEHLVFIQGNELTQHFRGEFRSEDCICRVVSFECSVGNQ